MPVTHEVTGSSPVRIAKLYRRDHLMVITDCRSECGGFDSRLRCQVYAGSHMVCPMGVMTRRRMRKCSSNTTGFESLALHHIKTHCGNLPAGEDTELVSGSVLEYGSPKRITQRALSDSARCGSEEPQTLSSQQ